MPDNKLLLIDDDGEFVAVLSFVLQRSGFTVLATTAAPTALTLLDDAQPELIMLDSTVVAREGLTLVTELRRRSAAVLIMLVGHGDEDIRVAGLEAGADDYVTKPCSPRELVARVRSLLRQQGAAAPAVPRAPTRLQVGPLTLDGATRTVEKAGERLSLTVMEFRLLQCLMAHAGIVQPMSDLLQQVWGYHEPVATDLLRTAVYRLRRKLGDSPAQPHFVHSVPGVGFVLRAELE